jgi:hypothetical protein
LRLVARWLVALLTQPLNVPCRAILSVMVPRGHVGDAIVGLRADLAKLRRKTGRRRGRHRWIGTHRNA